MLIKIRDFNMESPGTYINDAFSVSDQEIMEEPCFIEIPQANHVIHSSHRGGVHGTDYILILFVELQLLKLN